MNRQLTYALLLTPWLLAVTSSPAQVNFLTGDLELLRERGTREGKNLFVHFTANWCMPCQWMEQHAFRDQQLAAYIQQHYLPVKVDIDEQAGHLQKKKYRVTSLPSMLIIDDRGVVVDRFEEAMGAEKLYRLLQHHERARSEDHQAAVILEAPPRPGSSFQRPPLIPDKPVTWPSVTPHHEYASLPEAPPTTTTPSAPGKKPHYGIQIGVYRSYDNVMRQVRQLEQQFVEPVNVFTLQRDGQQNMYRILIGVFNDRYTADSFLRRLRLKNMEGIVKDINTL